MSQKSMEDIVSLCKRRGFVYPSSEIYGGLANVYDYGPLGVELLRNIRDLWWKRFVQEKDDILGIETAIFMHPKVWKASGHVDGFSDPMTEDKVTNVRYRADHLIEEWLDQNDQPELDVDSMSIEEMNKFIKDNNIQSPEGNELTPIKQFNLMFETNLGATGENSQKIYLRAETAQGMYVDFKNVVDSLHKKLPFGIAQQGRVFRNEITTGKFLFRMLEFQQMEIQYFFDGKNWEKQFENWRKQIQDWYFSDLKIGKDKMRWKPHSKLIFYAKAAEDIQYDFSWGYDEVSGLHYRTDYDLKTHIKHSGQKIEYTNPDGSKIVPHVLETTWGLDRNFFMLIEDAYQKQGDRIYLKLPKNLSPYQAMVSPLLGNKKELIDLAKRIYQDLLPNFRVVWDQRKNIGKRYAAQDEIGTPYCITVDFQSLKDDKVTVRDRDTQGQERISIDKISAYLQN